MATSDSTDLYISAGMHLFTPVQSRLSKIEEHLDSIDALFIEGRETNRNRRTRLRNWICAPLVLGFIELFLTANGLVSRVVPSDSDLKEKLKAKYELDPIKVDQPLHDHFTEGWYGWIISNYSVLLFFVAIPLYVGSNILLILGVFSIIVAIISLGMAFFGATMAPRNRYIADEIVESVSESDFDGACVIIGKAHESGVRRRLEHEDAIEIVN